MDLCKKAIEWAVAEKRVFLRQSLETKLCELYLQNKMYSDSLVLIDMLLKELKRLDDKNALMEVQLLESRVYHALRNLAKSKVFLFNKGCSYCFAYVCKLDILSSFNASFDRYSIRNFACRGKGLQDCVFKMLTRYSYFYEAMETFTAQEDERGLLALKYMLLCKIMLNLPEDVHNIINGKIAAKHTGPDIEAMNCVAKALEARSLLEFEQVLLKYKAELSNDIIIRTHLASLYDTLLEQNLLRIIEPYSRVEIAHVAQLVKLPSAQVEQKY